MRRKAAARVNRYITIGKDNNGRSPSIISEANGHNQRDIDGRCGRQCLLARCMGILGFFSLISAALPGIAANFAILFYDWLQQCLKDLNWVLFLTTTAILFATVHFFLQNGVISAVYRYLTLNPTIGYYRT